MIARNAPAVTVHNRLYLREVWTNTASVTVSITSIATFMCGVRNLSTRSDATQDARNATPTVRALRSPNFTARAVTPVARLSDTIV